MVVMHVMLRRLSGVQLLRVRARQREEMIRGRVMVLRELHQRLVARVVALLLVRLLVLLISAVVRFFLLLALQRVGMEGDDAVRGSRRSRRSGRASGFFVFVDHRYFHFAIVAIRRRQSTEEQRTARFRDVIRN